MCPTNPNFWYWFRLRFRSLSRLSSSGSANNVPKPLSLRPWMQLERLHAKFTRPNAEIRFFLGEWRQYPVEELEKRRRGCVACGVWFTNYGSASFSGDHHPIRQYYWGNNCKGWRRGMVLIRYVMGGKVSPAGSSQYYRLRTFWDLTVDGSIGRGSTTEIAIDYPWSASGGVIDSSILGPIFILVSNTLVFLEKPCGIPEYVPWCTVVCQSVHMPVLGHKSTN